MYLICLIFSLQSVLWPNESSVAGAGADDAVFNEKGTWKFRVSKMIIIDNADSLWPHFDSCAYTANGSIQSGSEHMYHLIPQPINMSVDKPAMTPKTAKIMILLGLSVQQ